MCIRDSSRSLCLWLCYNTHLRLRYFVLIVQTLWYATAAWVCNVDAEYEWRIILRKNCSSVSSLLQATVSDSSWTWANEWTRYSHSTLNISRCLAWIDAGLILSDDCFSLLLVFNHWSFRTDLGTDSEPHPVHCRLNRYQSIFLDRHWSNSTSN